MGTIRIAHISDLHFGSERQLDVWRNAREFINRTVKPHLVLVTGDIVHSPNRDQYRKAREELDQLIVVGANANDPYRVCAGNHDRHPWGNAPGPLQRVWESVASSNKASAWFADTFQGRIPTAKNPVDFRLEDGGDVWKIRVIGIDTSAEAKFTAQGFATWDDLTHLVDAARSRGVDPDLVVLMHHHHLLSIKELEESRQTLKNLFKPTIMLNAGTVLEALAQGSVNIVLHGHEHFRMFARYGTLYGRQSDTIVIGAGSVTGNHSTKGCDIRRASFNMIELLPDRTVQAQEVINRDGFRWHLADAPMKILDGAAVRRARSYRRTDSVLRRPSKSLHCVEFHADRTVDVTVSLTDWAISDGRWARATANNSGIPSKADVTFEWPQGEPTKFLAQPFRPVAGQMHTYRLEIHLAREAPTLARRITSRFQWLGGGILTKDDLAFFDSTTLGEFRSEGQEFWFVGDRAELESTSLLVRIPRLFAPKPDHVRVFYRRPGGTFEPISELAASVQHHASGVFSLDVPYPRPRYAYALAWPVADNPPSTAALDRFRRAARKKENAVQLLRAYASVLGRSSVARAISLGLYIPPAATHSILERTGELRRELPESRGEVPATLSLRNDNTLSRNAWWGRIQYALFSSGDPGFIPGERAIIMIPIRQFGHENEVSWGVVRIGIYTDGEFSDAALLQSLLKSEELEVFTDGIPLMLHSAAQMT